MKVLQFYLKYFLFRSTRKVENIERVIRSLGFEIYTFRIEAQNDPITRLICQLNAREYATHHVAFTASNEILKGVFVKHNLSADDRRKLLFHEAAHIWLNHLNITSFTDQTDVQQEEQANYFLLKVRFLKAVTAFAVVTALVIALRFWGVVA